MNYSRLPVKTVYIAMLLLSTLSFIGCKKKTIQECSPGTASCGQSSATPDPSATPSPSEGTVVKTSEEIVQIISNAIHWRAATGEELATWVPGVEEDIEEGIASMADALTDNTNAKLEVYKNIYTQYEFWEIAEHVTETMLGCIPSNVGHYRTLIRDYQMDEAIDEIAALPEFRQILEGKEITCP